MASSRGTGGWRRAAAGCGPLASARGPCLIARPAQIAPWPSASAACKPRAAWAPPATDFLSPGTGAPAAAAAADCVGESGGQIADRCGKTSPHLRPPDAGSFGIIRLSHVPGIVRHSDRRARLPRKSRAGRPGSTPAIAGSSTAAIWIRCAAARRARAVVPRQVHPPPQSLLAAPAAGRGEGMGGPRRLRTRVQGHLAGGRG